MVQSLILLLMVVLEAICYENVSLPITLEENLVNREPRIIRVLIIGDSNDLQANEDWCKKEKTRTLFTDKLYHHTVYSSSKQTLVDFVKPYPKRRKSWEIRMCESPSLSAGDPVSDREGNDMKSATIIVSSMTNKFGTKTKQPYSRPLATLGGLDGKESANFSGSWSVAELFTAATAPSLRILCTAAGGLPDGVLVHSMHQDLSHPPDFKEESTFLRQWEMGTLELFKVVKQAFPNTALYTRTGNKFAVFGDSWNNHESLEILEKMNSKIHVLGDMSGYHVIDYATMANKNWYLERMRPDFEENLVYMEHLVKQIYLRVKGKRGKHGGKGRTSGSIRAKREEMIERIRAGQTRRHGNPNLLEH